MRYSRHILERSFLRNSNSKEGDAFRITRDENGNYEMEVVKKAQRRTIHRYQAPRLEPGLLIPVATDRHFDAPWTPSCLGKNDETSYT